MTIIIVLLLLMLALLSILEVSFTSLNIIRIKRLADTGNKSAKVVYNFKNISYILITLKH